MRTPRLLASFLAFSFALAPTIATAQSAGRITGVGGIFLKSKDPKAMMEWYRDVLGVKFEARGGAMLAPDTRRTPAPVVLQVVGPNAKALSPSTSEFMINFTVDDLKTKGVTILKRDDNDPYGRFAWIVDPDGTKIELWEPKPK